MDRRPFLSAIRDHPNDRAPRLVYADWLDERGDPWGEYTRSGWSDLPLCGQLLFAGDADVAGSAVADDGGDAVAADVTADVGGVGGAGPDVGVDVGGDDNVGGDVDAVDINDAASSSRFGEGVVMKSGLVIVTIPSTAYWQFVVVGWAKVDGLNVTLYNCRRIRCNSGSLDLAKLANKGKQSNSDLLTLNDSAKGEWCHLTNIRVAVYADPAKWAKHCPKPEWWKEEDRG